MSLYDTDETFSRLADTEIEFEKAQRKDEIDSLILQARALKKGEEVLPENIGALPPLPKCPKCGAKRIAHSRKCAECGTRFN